jgi:DNA repair protein RadC
MKIVLTKVKEACHIKLLNPELVASSFEEIKNEVNEHFGVAFLNVQNEIISTDILFIGGYSQSTVDKRVVFSEALKYGASAIILCHNHPGGSLSPSSHDIALTKAIIKAGNVLDIKILDHVIISSKGFLSLRETGLVNFEEK